MRYALILPFLLLFGHTILRAQPLVNLGNDTAACAPILLDAQNVGATYLWSTGETTQQISATSTGFYWVDVADISGTTRDSLYFLLAAPVFSRPDTTLCAGTRAVSAIGSAAQIYSWHDAATGGTTLHTGQIWTNNFTANATYFVQARRLLDTVAAGYAAPLTGGNSGYYTAPDVRGLVFDVLQDMHIVSVDMPTQGSTCTGTIEIRNAANALIYSQFVTLNAGNNTVFLNVFLSAGTGYRITFINVVGGGLLHVGHGPALSYPRTANGLSITNGIVTGVPNASFYLFFYNFRLSTRLCTSARLPFAVTVNPAPIVQFPADTFTCAGSLTLDATNANTTYIWSNGATSATANFTQSGLHSVTATANGCTTTASTQALIGTTPAFLRADTTICAGTRTLNIVGDSGNSYYWYTQPTGGTPAYIGQAWTNNFTSSATYHIEGQQVLNVLSAGYPSAITGGASGHYSVPDVRGLVFNVLQDMQIVSVDMPIQGGACTGTIEIRNSSNVLLYSRNVSLAAGNNTVALNYNISAGTGYRITFINVVGAGLPHVGTGANLVYPRTANGLSITSGIVTGASNSSFYLFFYNFRVSSNFCISARQPFNLSVNLSPIVNFPADTLTCAGSLTLNATNAGATYLWSNGATSATANYTQSGAASVTVTASGCATTATTQALIGTTPVFSRADTTVCAGTQTLNIVGSGGNSYYWYTQPSGGTPVYTGQAWTNNFSGSTSYYIEGQQTLNLVSAGYPSVITGGASGHYSVPDVRGLVFDVLADLHIVSVDIPIQNGAMTGTIEIRNSANALIYSRNISLNTGNNTVALGANISVGTGYRILLVNVTGTGQPHVGTGAGLVYPRTNNGLRFTSGVVAGAANTSFYLFFYNFQLSTLFCRSARQPFNLSVNPSPIVNFPTDTLSCAGSLTLNATNAGATYLWSNGATTATAAYTQSGAASVSVTANACTTVGNTLLWVGNTPLVTRTDTTVCAGIRTLPASALAGTILNWYTAPTGGNPVFVGDAWTNNFSTSATYYIEGQQLLNAVSAGYPAAITGGASGHYSVPDVRGLVFDAQSNLHIISVDIPIQNGSCTGTVELRDAGNTLIYSRNVSLSIGNNTVNLNWNISTGTGYRILLTNVVGAGLPHVGAGSNVVYPNSANGLHITGGVVAGAPTASFYLFFYNFQLSNRLCTSPRQAFAVTVNPNPVSALPRDTVACGLNSLTLNVSQAGASYEWSNGATTGQNTFTQSTEASVTISLNGCALADTSRVHLLDTAQYAVSDTTFCAGTHTLSISGSAVHTYFWWDAPTGGSLQGTGTDITAFINTTRNYYIEGLSALSTEYEGLPNNTLVNGIGSGPYIITQTNGLAFTANNAFLLRSVVIYADGLVQGTVELQQANGTIINSRPITLGLGANQVLLDLYVPAAGNYRLVLRNPTGGGRLFVDAPNSGVQLFPLVYENLRITNSVINGTTILSGNTSQIYSFFYNWEIVRTACPTARQPLTANVLPTPVLSLPADTVFCAVVGSIDAANAQTVGASYLWDTGATSSNVATATNRTFSVTATIGTCTDAATVNVFLASPPNLLLAPNDTTICGGQITLHADGDAFSYAWYNTSSATTPFAIGDSVTFFASQDMGLWVEGVNFVPRLGVYGMPNQGATIFPTNYASAASAYPTRGIEFDALQPLRLDGVTLYTDSAAVQAKITLYDAFGIALRSTWIDLQTVGTNDVNLGWTVLPANGYKLELDSITGGKIYVSVGAFPYVYNEIRLQRGSPSAINNVYSYFYRWRISTLSCPTARDSVYITVPPYPTLVAPADTLSCDNASPIQITASTPSAGYTYLWGNGATTNSISASTSGYYSVTVTNNGLCTSVRNTLVQFLQSPAVPLLTDTAICSSSFVNLLQSPAGGIYTWFDYINPAQQTYLDAPYTQYIGDTSQYIVGIAARAVTRVGTQSNPTPQDPKLYSNFIIPNTFDLQQWAVFDSVAVYVQTAPMTFDIIIRNNSDSIIFQRTVSVLQPYTKTFLPIGVSLPPATGYRLEFGNNMQTRFLVSGGVTYPQTSSANIATLTGTTIAGISYPCFFDWHFSYGLATCAPTFRDTFTVGVRLPLVLADSLFACDSLLIDLTTPAASGYLWSTGATTALLTLSQAAEYSFTVSDGQNCSTIDTFRLHRPLPLTLPALGFNCDSTLLSSYSYIPNTQYFWSTGETTSSIGIFATPSFYGLTITSPEGCQFHTSAQINAIDRVPFFDLGPTRTLCVGASLSPNLFQPNTSFLWQDGSTASSIDISSTDNYRVTVTNVNGCTATDAVAITAQPAPVAVLLLVYVQALEVQVGNSSQYINNYHYNFGDGSPIALSPYHRYDTAGCYLISLVVENGCGVDTASFLQAVGGAFCDTSIAVAPLAAPLNPDMLLSPNPNAGQFELRLSEALPIEGQAQIFNAQGQQIHSQSVPVASRELRFSLADLPAGLYFLRLQYGTKVHSLPLQILRE